MDLMHGSNHVSGVAEDDPLDALFRAYRVACPTPDPSPEFMPKLWSRIEARQSFTFSFRRMANAFLTAAVAASLALVVYTAIPHRAAPNPSSYASYVEALADANSIETPDIVAPVRLDLYGQQ